MIDEVQFRRGEMLFLRKNYNDCGNRIPGRA